MFRCDMIISERGTTFEASAKECIDKLNFLNGLVKLSFFIDVASDEEIEEKKKIVKRFISSKYSRSFPEITFVCQKSLFSTIAVEYIQYLGKGSVAYNKDDDNKCVEISNGNEKMLFINGFTSKAKSVVAQAKEIFQNLKKLLDAYGLSVDSIVRQWNYIPKILEYEEGFQNYQAFNDVRAEFYNGTCWYNGYPAATGIGVAQGGLIMDFIALSGYNVYAIENPNQICAHAYSKKVLKKSIAVNNTPKFTRAKFAQGKEDRLVLVSGTAAIVGEESVAQQNVAQQTVLTLNHIETLLSNKKFASPRVDNAVLLQCMRAYIKHPSDFEIVKDICTERFPETSILYLVSDVCRTELLVEIEAFGVLG